MRLNKLRIGSEKQGNEHRYKNLKNVVIDFDEKHWVTVVIGRNGTGKSNVLEALTILFRDLIEGDKNPKFSYEVEYTLGRNENLKTIFINADPSRARDKIRVECYNNSEHIKHEDLSYKTLKKEKLLEKVKFGHFVDPDKKFLPRYLFCYYSGESIRMHEVIKPYLETYDSKLRNGDDPGMKRIFYALPIHSQFVLLSFLINQTNDIKSFLEKQLGLDPNEGIESVLFVLKQPPWNSKAPDGDPRFWNARGIVQKFLSRLYDVSSAPIRIKRAVQRTLWNRETKEFLYLFVKDMNALKELVNGQDAKHFFRDLESAYVSELIEEVRIRIKLKKDDGTVTFRELSEGEQQLLTVLGLLRFTAGEESLFLLDEPDTHLNPKWCVDYLNYLQKFAGEEECSRDTSHIVLTTHNPLSIAELLKEQVQTLSRVGGNGQIKAMMPDVDPRGMGYAGILTSDMFDLSSPIDNFTQNLLDEKRELISKPSKLSEAERLRLSELNDKLENLGFLFSMRDPDYERYLKDKYSSSKDDNTVIDHSIDAKTLRRKKASELIRKVKENLKSEGE